MDNKFRIKKVSQFMYWACICYLVIGLVFVLTFNGWLAINPQGLLSSPTLVEIDAGVRASLLAEHVVFLQRLIATVIGLIPFALGAYGIWRMGLFFQSCVQGDYFTATNARHLFIFAMMMLLSMLVGPATEVLMQLVLSLGAEDGSISLSISLDSAVFQTLFVSCILTAFSWIMLEGKRIAAENEEFI